MENACEGQGKHHHQQQPGIDGLEASNRLHPAGRKPPQPGSHSSAQSSQSAWNEGVPARTCLLPDSLNTRSTCWQAVNAAREPMAYRAESLSCRQSWLRVRIG